MQHVFLLYCPQVCRAALTRHGVRPCHCMCMVQFIPRPSEPLSLSIRFTSRMCRMLWSWPAFRPFLLDTDAGFSFGFRGLRVHANMCDRPGFLWELKKCWQGSVAFKGCTQKNPRGSGGAMKGSWKCDVKSRFMLFFFCPSKISASVCYCLILSFFLRG